jgi:hypothetical protein
MSAYPFGPSFVGEQRVLEQMRSRPNRERKSPRASISDPLRRHELIAEAAYYRAQRRGFTPGHELDDWLQAEAELARTT